MSCTVTADARTADLTVLVVGNSAIKAPRLVETVAARMAKGEVSGAQRVLTPDGAFLLLKREEKPWLVGGEDWRILGSEIASHLRSAGMTSATVRLEGKVDAQSLTEGVLLGDYRYLASRSGKAAERAAISIRVPGFAAQVTAGIRVAEAQNFARRLADQPPNLLNPRTFAEQARVVLRGSGLEVNVIAGLANLRKEGFPGLVQVGQAGSVEPCLVEIRYRPKQVRGKTRLALVGKGITFDSGGISLKPGDKMWEMKGDMGGAAAVLGAMLQIAASKPNVPVTGYLAIAENMPDSRAVRPGDIYKARNGTWIHVDNTDAEGRLVIGDVLTYAGEEGATHLVDVATLTGACMIALGDHVAGVMGRHDGWVQQVRAAGQEVGEEFWQLPLYGEYRSLLDHPHADLNNIGGRMGGAITAGLYLAEMVDPKVQWAHCDIAGPAIQSGGWRYYAKGMTGFATRTLARLAINL